MGSENITTEQLQRGIIKRGWSLWTIAGISIAVPAGVLRVAVPDGSLQHPQSLSARFIMFKGQIEPFVMS